MERTQLRIKSLASEKGHFNRRDSLISDEDFQLSARTYVRSNACKKGEPNLTSDMFAVWVKQKYDHDISEETARLWLHKLGFGRIHITKKEFTLMDTRMQVLGTRTRTHEQIHFARGRVKCQQRHKTSRIS